MEIEPTLDKIDKKINSLAERKSMTRQEFEEWSIRENNQLEITDHEKDLILAYQVDKTISKLFATAKGKEAEELDRNNYWIKYFKDDFLKVDEAIKHLVGVCAYVEKKYEVKYYYEWLLDWDTTLYNLCTEYKKKPDKAKFKME